MEEESGYFSLLPEGCVSDIISRTSPPDAIRFSAVSTVFKSAAESDIVWEKFLPSDYQQIISRSVSPVVYCSKKDLYLRLCDSPILIDDSKLSFSLDRRSGKKCYMIGAKELTIIWGGTPEYRSWTSYPDSRFMEVVELKDVCWLDIRGKMDTRVLSPNTTYTYYLVFTSERPRVLDSAKAYVRFVREIDENLAVNEANTVHLIPGDVHNGRLPQIREGEWMEIELGEFYNDQGVDGEVEMRLLEITRGHWKSGLIVDGMELRPKENV